MDNRDISHPQPAVKNAITISVETSVALISPNAARKVFEVAKKRLLDVNQWLYRPESRLKSCQGMFENLMDL
jgi:hypothetical protein